MPKIVDFALPPGGTVVQVADNQVALTIESTDARDFVVADTTDGSENLALMDSVVINKLGGGAGSLVVDTGEDEIHIGDGNGAVIAFQRAAGVAIRAEHASGSLHFQTGGAITRMSIDSAGAVSIPGTMTHTGDVAISKADPVFTMLNTTASDSHLARDSLIAFKGTQSGDEVSTLGSIRAEHYNGSDDQAGVLTIAVNDGNDADAPSDYLKLFGGQAEFNVKLRTKVGTAAEPGYSFYNDPNTGIFGDESDTVGISTAGVARITVNPAGKVAVGASTPEHLFHVQDGDAAVVTNSADAAAKNLVFTKSRNATDGAHTIVVDNDVVGTIQFKASDGNSFADVASIRAQIDGSPGDGDMPGSLRFATSTDGGETLTDRLVIRQNGNFGLGDTEPNYHATIGSSKSGPIIYNYNSNTSAIGTNYTSVPNGAAGQIIDHRVGDSLYLQNTTSENTAGGRETGIGFFGRVDLATDEYHYQGAIRVQHEGTAADQKGYMTFFTNDGDDNRAIQERMRIDSAGKVGINDPAPSYKLTVKASSTHEDLILARTSTDKEAVRLEVYDNVAGSMRIFSTNAAGSAEQNQHLIMGRNGSNGSVEFNIQKHDCDFRYSSSNETDMLFIDASAGKIGINESAPAGLISTKGTLTTQLSGTVTATNGSATVEGSGTDFKNELEWGSSIKILAEVFTVLSITDDDTLVLDSNYAGSTAGSLAYYTDPPAFDFRTGDDKPLFEAISTSQFHLGSTSSQGLKLGNTLFSNDDNAQSENTGFGVALGNLTTGNGNVLFGQSILSTKTGGSGGNVAVGRMIMSSGSGTASDNTIMGNAAGTIVAGGDGNCFFGHTAGNAVTSGDNNISIGKGSDCAAAVDNQIAIGYGSVTDDVNKMRLGNATLATADIKVDWTVDSDERIKENIQDANAGLDFINALRPVSFTRKHPAEWPEEIREKIYKQGSSSTDENGNKVFSSTPQFDVDTQQPIKDEFDDTRRVDGLIAQEVKAAIQSTGVAYAGLSEAKNGKMGVQYATLVVPLIKAVQELTARVAELEGN